MAHLCETRKDFIHSLSWFRNFFIAKRDEVFYISDCSARVS